MPVIRPGISRLLASLLYEALTVFSLLLAGFVFPQIVFYGFGMIMPHRLLWLHVFLVLMAYYVWCWVRGGQTLGMKSWRLRLVSEDGAPLRPLQAVLRYCAAWPSLLCLAGIVWMLLDKEHRFLHDRIAGTRIIQETEPPKQP